MQTYYTRDQQYNQNEQTDTSEQTYTSKHIEIHKETTICNLLSAKPLVLALAGLIIISGIILAIYEIILFIYSVIVFFKYNTCIPCAIPLYTWLVLAITVQAIRLFSKNTILLLVNFVASLVLFGYTIYYYNMRSICADSEYSEVYDEFFRLMIGHLIALSIWYAIILIIFVFCVVVLIFANWIIEDATFKVTYSLNPVNLFNILLILLSLCISSASTSIFRIQKTYDTIS